MAEVPDRAAALVADREMALVADHAAALVAEREVAGTAGQLAARRPGRADGSMVAVIMNRRR